MTSMADPVAVMMNVDVNPVIELDSGALSNAPTMARSAIQQFPPAMLSVYPWSTARTVKV